MKDLRWVLVVGIYIVWSLSGAAQILAPEDARVTLGLAIAASTLIVVWCTIDARRRGHPIVRIVQMLMWFFWPIAAPMYLIWSRSWVGFGFSVLHFIGFLVALFIGAGIAFACFPHLLFGL